RSRTSSCARPWTASAATSARRRARSASRAARSTAGLKSSVPSAARQTPVKRLTHDARILLLAAAAALPAVAVAVGILWAGDYSAKLRWTLGVIVVLAWLLFVQALRERVVRPLQTVSNLLAAMREEDFSIRARGAQPNDPLGEVLLEVNALAETLREQR